MAIGSGIGGSVGFSAETTYGTYVAPARWLQVKTEGLKKNKNIYQGGGLSGGTFMQPGSRRVIVTKDASGDIPMEVTTRQMGLLLNMIFGGTPTVTQQAATTAYLQSHPLADNIGKSLTTQVGIPDAGGVVRPYTFLGAKVTAAEFSCSLNQKYLMVTLTLDAQDVTEAQSLVAPSYITGLVPFHFGQMGFKLGTYGSEAAVQGVSGVTLKVERPQATDRFYANNGGIKMEPIWNNWAVVSGSLDVDYIDKTVFADRFRDDTNTSMVWEFIGANIASTYYQTFRIRCPQVFFEGESPTLDDTDVTDQSIDFSVQYDGTNVPVTAEYMSTDTVI